LAAKGDAVARRARRGGVLVALATLLTTAVLVPGRADTATRRIDVTPIPTIGVAAPAPGLVGVPSFATESPPTATFDVRYSGFDEAAQAAFGAAADVWARAVVSEVPIVVDASFRSFGPGEEGFIGLANPVVTFGDAIGRPDDAYPTALLNSLAGEDVLPNDPDIVVDFNSDSPFYFGTDGLAPAGTYDFMSLVMHELNHGMAFAGFRSVDGERASVGFFDRSRGSYVGLPWDFLTVDRLDRPLLNGPIPNNSAQMKAVLTSDHLFWGGAAGTAATGGTRPKLHAPDEFSQASSYVHLDEAAYPPGDENSLMTPALNTQEAIHQPGLVALGIMADEGWRVAGSAPRTGTTATLASSQPTATEGETVTFTAAIASTDPDSENTPGGDVQFAIDNNPAGAVPLTDGTAAFTTTELAPGTHVVLVSYAGDAVHDPSSASVIQKVRVAPSPQPPRREPSPLCKLVRPVLRATGILTCR
jgi:hypothetical protein